VEAVITAVHALLYSDDETATRAFLRDVLEWPNVDVHDGWLIFKTGPSELGTHPISAPDSSDSGSSGVHHEISLMCDDLEQTVAELVAKGVEFTGGPTVQRWGITIMMKVPGAGEVMLYQAGHPTAYDL
jgi:catechol 2,3-dioxygenase-like lactoylglutathione lyase family enzyme